MAYKDFREEWTAESLLAAERNAEYTLREMKEAYEIASQQIQDDINRILNTVISRNDLTISASDLRKELSKAEVRTWKKTVADYMDEIEKLGGIKSIEGNALWMELEYLSAYTRITRLDAIQMSIDANMSRIATLNEKEIANHLNDVFTDDYYNNMYMFYLADVPEVNALMEATGVAVTNSMVQTIVNEAYLGHTLSQRIWKNEYVMAFRVKEAVSKTLISGKSVSEVAKDLVRSLKVGGDKSKTLLAEDVRNARRLVLTETVRVKTAADIRSYEEAGFDEVEWSATLDYKTCHICSNKDGKIYKIKDLQDGVNKPPEHPNCRCVLLPISDYLSDLENKFSYSRFSRDKDGTKVWVDGKLKYKEWMEMQNEK